mgnify:CR=1 FL=1
MNFNPLMLLPLMMGAKNDDNDMSKMLEMMNVLKDGSPDALLNALPVDEKTKTMLNMVGGMNALKNTSDNNSPADFPENKPLEKPRPDTKVFGTDINIALQKLMNNPDR